MIDQEIPSKASPSRTAAGGSLARWKIDAFLAATISLNFGARGILPVVLPAMRADFHFSDVAFGLLGSLFLWSYAICAPIAGMFGDLFSRRLVILVSVVTWSATTFLSGAANGFLMLALLRVVFGVSESLYLPAATALQADYHQPETRTRAMGLNSLAGSGGVVLWTACAGFIGEHFGWRYAFWALGLVGVALTLSSPYLLSEAPVTTNALARTKSREALAYLIKDPTYLLLVTNEILLSIAGWIFFFWLPLYLYETYGIKMAAAGFSGMATLQFSGMFGIAVGTWVSHRFPGMDARDRLLLFALGFLAAAPCLLTLLFHPSHPIVTISIAAFSILRGMGGVYEMPVLCDVVPPPYRSTAVGILIAGACSAGGLGVFVAGCLKQSLGLTGVFATLGGVSFLSGLALIIGYWMFVRRDVERANAWMIEKSV